MRQPKISIIFIPPKKDKILIEKTIKSILYQSFTDLELLLVLQEKDLKWYNKNSASINNARVRLVITKGNTPTSLNRTLKNAHGKYICFIDTFGEFKPNRVGFQYNYLRKCNVGAIGVGIEELDEEGNTINILHGLTYREIRVLLFKSNIIPISSLMFKKSLLSKYQLHFNIKYNHAYSYEFIVQAIQCFPMKIVKNVLSSILTAKPTFKNEVAERLIEENLVKIHQLKYLQVNCSRKQAIFHLKLLQGKASSELELKSGEVWFNKLLFNNTKAGFLNRSLLYRLFETILDENMRFQNRTRLQKEFEFTLDVVLVSFAVNRKLKDLTQQAIDSSGFISNVIVIEYNKEIRYENATVVYPNVSFGYNKSLNIGARKGTGKYIFFGNNDLIFSPGWEVKLVANMQKHQVISASPLCPYHGRFFNIDANSGCFSGYETGSIFCGWAFIWTRNFYKSVGQLDETFVFWHSDDAVIHQLKECHEKHVLVTSSIVKHVESGYNTIQFLDDLTIRNYTILETQRYDKWCELKSQHS